MKALENRRCGSCNTAYLFSHFIEKKVEFLMPQIIAALSFSTQSLLRPTRDNSSEKTYLRKMLRMMMTIAVKLFIFPVYCDKKPIFGISEKKQYYAFFKKRSYFY